MLNFKKKKNSLSTFNVVCGSQDPPLFPVLITMSKGDMLLNHISSSHYNALLNPRGTAVVVLLILATELLVLFD